MKKDYTLDLINVVKEDTNPALGCTEPVAVAFAASVAADHSEGKLKKLDVIVSKNIYKNGKSVLIPHTGKCGLDLAAAVGFVGGDSAEEFMVLSSVNPEDLKGAEAMLDAGIVNLSYDQDTPDVYVKIIAHADNNVEIVLQDAHTHIHRIIVDDEIIYEGEFGQEVKTSKEFLKELTFKEIREITEGIPIEDLAFIMDGVEMNLLAAEAGLEGEVGLGIGKKLKNMEEQGLISMDAGTKSRILTAAAADMRMGGGECPIMTSGGSGNQGLGVILPIYVVAEEKGLDEETLLRGVFFAHSINEYVKIYSGKLSGMCGCAIGAGIGATAGITWMLDGNDVQIAGAANNMFANISGMLCDGAKDTCSLKLATSAAEAVLSAYLSLNGVLVNPKVGVIGENIEETIKNIGKLAHQGFKNVDDTMLEIIDQ